MTLVEVPPNRFPALMAVEVKTLLKGGCLERYPSRVYKTYCALGHAWQLANDQYRCRLLLYQSAVLIWVAFYLSLII